MDPETQEIINEINYLYESRGLRMTRELAIIIGLLGAMLRDVRDVLKRLSALEKERRERFN
jgi:hypothetical protein